MHIIFVDDEANAHVNFCHEIKLQRSVTSLNCFFTAEEALTHIENNLVDCAFLDIDLSSKISGLDLARYLKATHPNIEVAFMTAYAEYTKLSYELGGRAYVTKPYSSKELQDALHLMERLVLSHTLIAPQTNIIKSDVKIRTFGNFDLIVDGRAVVFKTAKAKEILAFLINQMGGSVGGAEIFFALWEGQEYNTSTAVYVRRTIQALKEELETLNISDILVCGRNNYSVDIARLDCDSYALLNGSEKEAIFYNGEYMRQYPWGENTIPLLDRATRRILEQK